MVAGGVVVIGVEDDSETGIRFENVGELVVFVEAVGVKLKVEVLVDVERGVLSDVESELAHVVLVCEIEGVAAD